MISVIVPVFNVEAYLADCLDSVLAQTVGDLEVVLVDDGSTDGSAAIAQSYVARDDRFRIVSQPNGGLSKARNTPPLRGGPARPPFLCNHTPLERR